MRTIRVSLLTIASAIMVLFAATFTAQAAPGTGLAKTAESTGALAAQVVTVGHRYDRGYRSYYGKKRHYKRRKYRRHYRYSDNHVDAPYTRYRGRGRVHVDAPFAYVKRNRRGLHVRAPFVDLYIPRY